MPEAKNGDSKNIEDSGFTHNSFSEQFGSENEINLWSRKYYPKFLMRPTSDSFGTTEEPLMSGPGRGASPIELSLIDLTGPASPNSGIMLMPFGIYEHELGHDLLTDLSKQNPNLPNLFVTDSEKTTNDPNDSNRYEASLGFLPNSEGERLPGQPNPAPSEVPKQVEPQSDLQALPNDPKSVVPDASTVEPVQKFKDLYGQERKYFDFNNAEADHWLDMIRVLNKDLHISPGSKMLLQDLSQRIQEVAAQKPDQWPELNSKLTSAFKEPASNENLFVRLIKIAEEPR
jgi:hypothetical protein